ncbi:MAG: hypothetical protein ACI9TH_002796 [Kiritimatiellia bacterium]|jgi:hypothetical protein
MCRRMIIFVCCLVLSGLAQAAITVKKLDGTSVTGSLRIADARGVTLQTTAGVVAVAREELAKPDQETLQSWLDGKAVPPGFEKPANEIKIETGSGNLAYDLEEFETGPGESVVLSLTNTDELQHNLIVCAKPGEVAGQDMAFSALLLGGDGMEKEWVPAGKDVYAASRMANPHETTRFYFHAPAKAESYAYVCTFPGHSQVMKGLLIVGGGADTGEPAVAGSSADKPGLNHVKYQLYKGSWKELPDWSKLTPTKEGRVKGLCDMKAYGQKESFGLVFTGVFTAPKTGAYTFNLASDDGSRIVIDGKAVVTLDGIHPVKPGNGKVTLSAGAHDFRMEYFEGGGQEDLFASWKGPGTKEVSLTPGKVSGGSKGGGPVGIPLYPPAGEAMIYRNFIEGVGGARGIGVGYSEGVHLAYDAENGRIAMMWRGGFIDAKRHWNGRGQGYQPPSATPSVADPRGQMLASLASPADEWPSVDFVDKGKSKLYTAPDRKPSAYQFKGYELNAKRQPTFLWTWHDLAVSDFPVPSKEGGFTRTLQFKGPAPATGPLYVRIANGDTGLSCRVEGATPITSGAETRVPIDLSSGQAELILHYTFN